METPIVFSMDDGYAIPTAVAISSLVNYYNDSDINIIILYEKSLSTNSIKIINRAINKAANSIVVKYIDVGGFFNNVSSHIKHITKATYFRLAIPFFLAEYDQCLYLDGDIVVKDDLSKLCHLQLRNDEYIGGVSSEAIRLIKNERRLKYCNDLEIANLDQYINAGVLLMNLDAFRRENLSKQMINEIPNNYDSQDQDIINKICFGHIRIIPPRYNAMPQIFQLSRLASSKVYGTREVIRAQRNPAIIHYSNKYKPWKYKNIPRWKDWDEAYGSLGCNEIIKYNSIPIREICHEININIKREAIAIFRL